MENATKALLMAAGVLIALIILSIGVYLFSTLGSFSANIERQNEVNRINQFNSKYTVYIGRTDLSIHDVITIINSARNNNENYYTEEELKGNEAQIAKEENYYIKVIFDNKSYTALLTDGNYRNTSKLLEESVEKKYTCSSVKISSYTGRVYHITIKNTEE